MVSESVRAAAGDLSRSLLRAALARSEETAGLEEELRRLDPCAIADNAARIALWLNLYNALLLRELNREPRTGSVLRHRGLFASAAYRVGEHEYSLDVIEHGLLRLNGRPPYRLRRLLRRSDPRRAAAPSHLDPRIHFALNCGAVSCPPIHAYGAADLDIELEAAATSYIRAETVLDRERGGLQLPYLMRLYSADFGDRDRAREFAAARLAPEDGAWVRQRRPTVSYGRFDWSLAER
jgi:hypothetical protein